MINIAIVWGLRSVTLEGIDDNNHDLQILPMLLKYLLNKKDIIKHVLILSVSDLYVVYLYFAIVDLAGSEGHTALCTKNEFIDILNCAIVKGKTLYINKKQLDSVFGWINF